MQHHLDADGQSAPDAGREVSQRREELVTARVSGLLWMNTRARHDGTGGRIMRYFDFNLLRKRCSKVFTASSMK